MKKPNKTNTPPLRGTSPRYRGGILDPRREVNNPSAGAATPLLEEQTPRQPSAATPLQEGNKSSAAENNSPSVKGCLRYSSGDGVVKWYDLPFNPKLKQRARELRTAGNLSEVLLWNAVKHKQLLGLDFDRQKIIGDYIVDFYCRDLGVIVEIDGQSHENKVEYDKARDSYFKSLGLKVIHVLDKDVKTDLDGVLRLLKKELSNTPPLRGTSPRYREGIFGPRREENTPSAGAATPLSEERTPRPPTMSESTLLQEGNKNSSDDADTPIREEQTPRQPLAANHLQEGNGGDE